MYTTYRNPDRIFQRALFWLLILLCYSASALSEDTTRKSATEYFDTYAERKDFDRLMSFYAENASFNDVLTDIRLEGRDKIAEFLNWSLGDFAVVGGGPALVIERQVISGNSVVTEGTFPAFTYDGNQLGPWEFVIWLEFNDAGKITRHTDWINYKPKKILIGIEAPEP